MRILIADDNAIALQVLEGYLKSRNHQVISAYDGEDAWELFEKEKPQVIITDWMMPGLDGLELCRRLRGTDTDRYTYVILLTVKGGKRNFLEALDAGADDFMTKPFDSDELAARLHVAERIVSLQKQVRQYEKILPICMYCKKIRNELTTKWDPVDLYIEDLTEQALSHGVCPECYKEQMRKMGFEDRMATS